MTIYLVRHAQAGKRHDWNGEDRDRPLSEKGHKQAAGLVDRFGDRPITRVLSSPFTRCQETVEPLAELLGLRIELTDVLAEGASRRSALELIKSLGGTEAVLCSHGDVVPEVISALAAGGVAIDGPRSAAKGGTYVITVEDGRPVSAAYVEPPGR